jgi:hypothetical protein
LKGLARLLMAEAIPALSIILFGDPALDHRPPTHQYPSANPLSER